MTADLWAALAAAQLSPSARRREQMADIRTDASARLGGPRRVLPSANRRATRPSDRPRRRLPGLCDEMTDLQLLSRLSALRLPVVFAVAATLTLAGCGDNASPAVSPASPPATGGVVTPPPPVAAAEMLPAPTGLRVGSTGARSITWEWEPVEGADIYAVLWTPTEQPTGTPPTDYTEKTIYALAVEPETTVYFRVAALRKGKDGPDFSSGDFSDPVRGQSNPLAKLETPRGFQVLRIEGHLVYLKWEPVEGADRYAVRHTTEAGSGANLTTATDIRMIGRYDEVVLFDLRALPPEGADVEPSDWTDALPVNIGAGPLPPPTGLNVVDATTGSLTWSWEAVEGAHDYECQWTTDPRFRSATGRYTERTTCTHWAEPDVEVHFRVRARRNTDPRLGRWSEPETAETEPPHVSEIVPAWVPPCPSGERCADPEEWADSPLLYWDDPDLPDSNTIILNSTRTRYVWSHRPRPGSLPSNCAGYEEAAGRYSAQLRLHPPAPLPFIVDVERNFPTQPVGDRRPASYDLILKQIEALAAQIEDGTGIEVIRAGSLVSRRRGAHLLLSYDPDPTNTNIGTAWPKQGYAKFTRWSLASPKGEEGLREPGAIAAVPHELMHLLGFHHRGGYSPERAFDAYRDGVHLADDGVLAPHQTRFRDRHDRGRLFAFDDSLFLSEENLRRVYCVFRDYPQ